MSDNEILKRAKLAVRLLTMDLGELVECLMLAKEKQASSEVIEIVELAIQQRQEIEK